MHPVIDLALAILGLFLGIHSMVQYRSGVQWKILMALEFFMAGAFTIISAVEFALLR